jgi:hypothetical protein
MSRPHSLPFTPERRRTLQAVVGRILPGTDGPGAATTDVAVSVERAMLQPVFAPLRQGVEAMLDHLQAQSAERGAAELSACAPGEQDDLLGALAQDPNPAMRFLFRSLIAFSLEGLLGDPIHGGNRDFLGWQALGLRASDVRSGFCRRAQES